MDLQEQIEELSKDFPEYNDGKIESLIEFIDAVVRYVVITDLEEKIGYENE